MIIRSAQYTVTSYWRNKVELENKLNQIYKKNATDFCINNQYSFMYLIYTL